MNKSIKVGMVLAVLMLVIGSFMLGKYVNAQENTVSRQQRCRILLSFAINKIETEDLEDQGTMKALISNIYAAYEYCDKPALAAQLHDLWNALVFDSGAYGGNEEVLLEILEGIALSVSDEA